MIEVILRYIAARRCDMFAGYGVVFRFRERRDLGFAHVTALAPDQLEYEREVVVYRVEAPNAVELQNTATALCYRWFKTLTIKTFYLSENVITFPSSADECANTSSRA